MSNQIDFIRRKLLGKLLAGLGLAIISVAGSAGICAQSPSRIVRPRMLIGERDPLTGFRVLRARYAAGLRNGTREVS